MKALGCWLGAKCLFWRGLWWVVAFDRHSPFFSPARFGMWLLELSARIAWCRPVERDGFWCGWWEAHYGIAREALLDDGWTGEMVYSCFRKEFSKASEHLESS